MAGGLREIRRKIKGVKATRQVTKAMELVSAAKMRKAIQNAMQLRRYSKTAWSIIEHIASVNTIEHPAFQSRPVKRVLIILFTSDRGLAGSFNAHMNKLVTNYLSELKKLPGFEKASFIVIGKKGQQLLARSGQHVIAAFPAFSVQPSFRDVLPIARMALSGFKSDEFDHVAVLFQDFISALQQEPKAKVILPLSQSALSELVASIRSRSDKKDQTHDEVSDLHKYTFEPSPAEVINVLLPQITELQIYQALLEAVASEHSARMVAMHNATDNATDLIDDLTLVYNQTRQSNITSELTELSASKAALD